MAGGKQNSIGTALRALALGLLATTCLTGQTNANPTGAAVAAGQATVSQSATGMTVNATSAKTIINYTSFSIQPGESFRANLPGAGSVLLNRVVNSGPASYLLGSMTSNGRIFLINPAGIVVGPGARITAAQVLLSTAGISDTDFLNGNYNFNIAGQPGAAVANHGAISATGGAAILAGEQVQNDGVIAAQFGTVVLAGAKTYTVDFAGDGLLKFAITAPVEQVAPGAKALVENSGTLAAQGGTVLLTAAAAKGVIANVINTSGIVEATSVAQVNGKIVLSGSGGGTAVAGTLDASGKGAGETGGQVAVEGDSVTLASGAQIDVAGDLGGGTALIHGAEAATMAQDTAIAADAITRGDGGTVKLLSDGTTELAGAITAQGGAQGGRGGFVETSGERLGIAGGKITVGAAQGKPGTWLLDPFDLTIDSGGAAAVVGALANGNVTIVTSADGATGGFGPINANGNGDITVSADVIWNSANTLTLSAYRNVNINATVMSMAGGVLVAQPNTGGGGGTLNFSGVPFSTFADNLLVNGSFEQLLPGNVVPGPTDIPGWTQIGNSGATSITTAGSGYVAQQGSYFLDEGPVGSDGVLTQSFSDTAGQTLFLSGWVAGNGSGTSDFGFMFNAQTVLNVPNTIPFQPYTFYMVPVTATGRDTFTLFYRNDPSFDAIDNLAVSGCTGAACIQGVAIALPTTTTTPPPSVLLSTLVASAPPPPPVLTPPPPPQVAPPPPAAPLVTLNPVAGAAGTGEVLVSVTNIDTGGTLFTQISPGSGGSASPEPVAVIPPVTPAPQAQPKPQVTSQPIGGAGSNLFQTKTFFVPPQGVPGIDQPASTSGNRSLWFAAGGA